MGTKMSVKKVSTVESVPPYKQTQSEIFNLKMDHFEEIFDYLSLGDLVMLSETCKRMQHIVGFYIKTNYTATKFQSTKSGIHARIVRLELNGLRTYLKRLVFYDLECVRYDFWERKWKKSTGVCVQHMKADQFQSLMEIALIDVVLSDKGISLINEILGQLDTVKLKYPRFLNENNEFYESFLQFCTNLKKLCIQGEKDTTIVGVDNSWLLRKYPTLEHIELTTNETGTIDELQMFFEQNTNVKSFATDAELILVNSDIFENTTAKWNVLSVRFTESGKMNLYCDLLNELHKRGRFKQLHVYFPEVFDRRFDDAIVRQLILYNSVTKLYISNMKIGTDLSPLVNLRQICIKNGFCIKNKEIVAKSLVNLEFIQIIYATVYDITPFIRYSPKLSAFVVFRKNDNKNMLNIVELNDERSKLVKARQVTVYVDEAVYLAMKWTKNQTNQSLIRIKRYESYDALHNSFYCIPM